jgi:hypothetical protein
MRTRFGPLFSSEKLWAYVPTAAQSQAPLHISVADSRRKGRKYHGQEFGGLGEIRMNRFEIST